MAQSGFKVNKKALTALQKQLVDEVCVPMAEKVADACNRDLGDPDGYRVSIEGDDPLDKRDYRATVIAASAHAIQADRKHDYLLRNFGQAQA